MILEATGIKTNLQEIKQAKRQIHNKNKKDKENESKTKYVAPFGG